MNLDPTISISCDYLVEFADNGEQPDQGDSEVIIIPPAGPESTSPPPGGTPQQQP
jgi:hypothetical protein